MSRHRGGAHAEYVDPGDYRPEAEMAPMKAMERYRSALAGGSQSLGVQQQSTSLFNGRNFDGWRTLFLLSSCEVGGLAPPPPPASHLTPEVVF